jgi:diacylglycerol kinase family enzyme
MCDSPRRRGEPYDSPVSTADVRLRAVLIVNPFATGVTRDRVEQVEQVLGRSFEVVTRLTDARGHARELAAEAAGSADAVVVFSGDGTYNEAINGAGGRIPFGFLPGGGASVFSRALGLPRDPAAAAEKVAAALAEGRSLAIGLGRVNGRRFCFSAGVGLDAEVVRRIEARGRADDGRRPSNAVFVSTLVGLLARARFRLEPQLELVGRGRAAFVLVACGRPYTYAGPLPLRLSEGGTGLDFVAPERVTPASTPELVVRLLRGSLAGASGVIAGQGVDRFEVRCDRPLPLQADGEDLGDVTAALFEAEEDALTVLV